MAGGPEIESGCEMRSPVCRANSMVKHRLPGNRRGIRIMEMSEEIRFTRSSLVPIPGRTAKLPNVYANSLDHIQASGNGSLDGVRTAIVFKRKRFGTADYGNPRL